MKELLPSDLGVCIPDDKFHIIFWAPSVGLAQTLIEFILHICWRLRIDQAIVEEFVLLS